MADPADRLRAMLHQISWHAADAASHPDRTVEQLRAELRRIAAIAGREARRDTAEVGRCGLVCEPLIPQSQSREVCALPAGHAGWHRSDGGCEWGEHVGERLLAAGGVVEHPAPFWPSGCVIPPATDPGEVHTDG